MAVILSLYDGNGNLVRSNASMFQSSPVAMGFTAPASGTYYLAAEGQDYYSLSGSYSVLAELRKAPDDLPDNNSTGVNLQIGVSASAQGEVVGDSDFFRFRAEAGKSYQIELPGATASTIGDVSILDSSGKEQDYTVAFQPQQSGDYYLQHIARAVLQYSLRIREVTDDFGNSPALASGQLIAGPALEVKTNYRYDPDYIRVGLEADTLYAFRASGGHAEFGEINLWSQTSNTAVASIWVADRPSIYLAPATGSYTVSVTTDSSILPAEPYRLQLAKLGKVSAQATSGDDLLMASRDASASLDGGAGTDAVYLASFAANYPLSKTGRGFSAKSTDGTIKLELTNVERIHFSDKSYALDLAGAGGQAYRLYEAAFNRTPDKAGVGFWIAQLDQGMALSTVAGAFVASAEFAALSGSAQTNLAFVNLLYGNILNRPGEQAGIDYWVKAMDGGLSRADVLMFFSESKENQDSALTLIGSGFEYIPYG